MKTVKIVVLAMLGLGITLVMSGCSTMETVMGAEFSSIDHNLADADKSVSEVTEVKFKEGNSYVVYIAETIDYHYNHPSALYEVVEGKIVFAGLIKERPGRMVMEVKPGMHTYLQKSSCGIYTIAIDVKKGYAYYINENPRGLGKLSLMAYCRSQGYFDFQGYMDETNVYHDYKNYSLVPENKALADKIVANSGLQSDYESFIEDIDDLSANRKLLLMREIEQEAGFRVGPRF